jgi:hypothetical protein
VAAGTCAAKRKLSRAIVKPAPETASRNLRNSASLSAVLVRNRFRIEASGIDNGGQLFAVARKFATPATGCGNTATIAA